MEFKFKEDFPNIVVSEETGVKHKKPCFGDRKEPARAFRGVRKILTYIYRTYPQFSIVLPFNAKYRTHRGISVGLLR